MKNLCVIPARGGSKRIPKKNIKVFAGKPIIAYSIEKALETNLFDRVVVSTDDEEICKVAAMFGAELLIRPEHLADDHTGTFDVVRHAVECYKDERYDRVCCVYATAPLMSVADLIEGYLVLDNYGIHSISVGYPPLRDAAQFYWSEVHAVEAGRGYWQYDTNAVYINPERVCDINTMEDWNQALAMYEKLEAK